MESSRRFKPPWTLIRESSECYVVRDANGVTVAWLFCRDDSQRYSYGVSKLASEEARRIGKAISRILSFATQRRGFHPRGRAALKGRPTRWHAISFRILHLTRSLERVRDISPTMTDPNEWETRGWFVETEDELSAIDDMESTSDRTAAIVIASLVETRLTNTLQAGLHHDDAIVERLFRASGPLGSFSAKIDLACLMGAISKDAYRDLVILKNIRNIFAHRFKSASFTEQRIADLCRNFRLIETMICDMEEEAPMMEHPPFTLKITGYRHHLSNPRGRYVLTGHLFVAGLDKRTAKRHTSTIYDPWI
jgi:hypothetical protein